LSSTFSSIMASSSSSDSIPTLQIDFSWKKFKALVTDQTNPDQPIYIIDCKKLKAPHIVFKDAIQDAVVATATLHAVSIDTDYDLRGYKGTLKALKRLHTSYTHLSYNYSDSETPMAMTWVSAASFKTWDFTCLDENQMPVAKFASRPWGAKKVGTVEFSGPKAHLPAAREEALVIGLTLYYTMLLRANNIFSLVGAAIAKPGPLDKNAAPKDHKKSLSDDDTISLDSLPKPPPYHREVSELE
ncbi:hypothetical protein BGZ63DRAFT_366828, partial [Mariannaea sp. PMI_226]